MVSYRDRSVLMLHKLHQSPITTIAATESFCVTAAEDKYIRVCPLDFQSFFLHCMHEAVPQGVDLTAGDGLKVLSYTADGTIGQLDMQTQGFDVIHRAHASRIVDGAVSVLYEELVTVTEDGFIKIWSINTMRQHTEFFSGTYAERFSSRAYHDLDEVVIFSRRSVVFAPIDSFRPQSITKTIHL